MSDPFAAHRSTPAELQARLAVESGALSFLLYRDPSGAQRIVALDPEAGALSIGRDASADVSLAWDQRVSRLHATLEPAAGAWSISDDGLSRNGTAINLARISGRRRLRPGDVVRIGDTELLYQEPAGERTTETVLAHDAPTPVDLSGTQRRVLVELCRPLHRDGPYTGPATNSDIAAAVFLSEPAVKTHLRTLFAKFGLSDMAQNAKRVALAQAALQSGAIGERDFG